MANRVFVSMMNGEEVPPPFAFAEDFLIKVMDTLALDGEEVSVSFCTDSQIMALNKKWRGADTPTDVLSFEDGGEYTDEEGIRRRNMGDIVISFDTLSRSKAEVGEDEGAELRRLLVHGLLHLNGYDHGDEHIAAGKTPEGEMLRLQEKILEGFEEKDEHIQVFA